MREKGHNVEQIQVVLKKSGSFADKGNLFKVFRSFNEDDNTTTTFSSDDHGELGENIGAEAEEIKVFFFGTEDVEEEGDVVNGGPSQTNNGERNHITGSIIISEGNSKIKGHNKQFVFFAPLPVQMEDKADLMKRKNAVNILR